MSKIPRLEERPDHVKQRIAERQDSELDFGTIPDELKKGLVPRAPTRTTHDANAVDRSCKCFDPHEKAEWSQSVDIGMTDDYWDVTRLRCAHCGTLWVRAFLEYEAFSRSGRHYRAPVSDEQIQGVSPEEALEHIEAAEFRIAGGSYFDGRDHVTKGPGKLSRQP